MEIFLRQIGGNIHDLFLLRVEIDLEVLGSQNLPVELGILNLVLSEVILGRKRRGQDQDQCQKCELLKSHNLEIIKQS